MSAETLEMPDLDTDIDQDFDLEKEVPCVHCDNVAAWISIHKCCNLHLLYCETHHKFKVLYVENIVKRNGNLLCGNCDKPIQPRMLKWVQL